MPTYLKDEAPVWSGVMNYNDTYSGTLYITNRRLLFERRVGVIRRRNILAAEIQLSDITSTSIEKGPWNWTALIIVAGGQKHRFLFSVDSPAMLVTRLSELLSGQKEQGTGEGVQPHSA
jgi:hypothetical protein